MARDDESIMSMGDYSKLAAAFVQALASGDHLCHRSRAAQQRSHQIPSTPNTNRETIFSSSFAILPEFYKAVAGLDQVKKFASLANISDDVHVLGVCIPLLRIRLGGKKRCFVP